ncbi:MAG: helix-turn-helix domain-containing protein, partial [Candidatus Dormibacteraceae bacterium]
MGRRAASLELADHDREQLAAWAGGRGRRALRARIVLRSAEPGAVNKQVAAELGVTPVTASKWRAAFRRHGLAGLADRPRAGRP